MNPVGDRLEQIHDGSGDIGGGFPFYLADEGQAGFALRSGAQSLVVALADYCIQFLIPQPRAPFDNRGTVFDREAVGAVASTTIGAIAFAALPLTP